MRVTDKYVFFWAGEFSNFHPAEFTLWNKRFNCSEQAYMYSKAYMFMDIASAKKILEAKLPKDQKKLGRLVVDFDQAIWDKFKFQVMYKACYAKFDQNPRLKKMILSYPGKHFVEASPYDKIWGVGLAEEDPLIDDPKNWKGENLLGLVLSKVRDELESEAGTTKIEL